MQNIILRIIYIYYHPRFYAWMRFLFCLLMIGMSCHAFADDGTDVLKGTSNDAIATFNGTGKTFILLGEVLLGAFAYIKTKNLLALIGVVVLSLFFNDVVSHFVTQS